MRLVHRFVVVLAIVAATLVATAVPSSAAITARMEVTKVPQGQLAYARGQTDPGQKIVFVQRWNGSRWYDVAGAAVFPDGSFRVGLRPKDRGIYTFRVRSKSGGTISGRFYLNVTAPIIYGHTGTGGTVSNYFTLPANWIGSITADCSNTEYGFDNFIVKLFYNSRYGPTYDLVANEVPKPSFSTTFTTYSAVGTAYISVETDCNWSITITGR